MNDKGLVINSSGTQAKVAVDCLSSACHDCSARSLCSGKEKNLGILTASNPIHASIGDEVIIEIPDHAYNRTLISLFGGLLLAVIAGTGIGYVVGNIFSFSISESSLAGLLLFLITFGYYFGKRIKKKNRELFPVITDILRKGASHG